MTSAYPHATAIVLNLQQLDTALLYGDSDMTCAGVQAVLQHLLDRGRWALYDFTGSNPMHHRLFQCDDGSRLLHCAALRTTPSRAFKLCDCQPHPASGLLEH